MTGKIALIFEILTCLNIIFSAKTWVAFAQELGDTEASLLTKDGAVTDVYSYLLDKRNAPVVGVPAIVTNRDPINHSNAPSVTRMDAVEIAKSSERNRKKFIEEISNVVDPILDVLQESLEKVLDYDLSMGDMSENDIWITWGEILKKFSDNIIRRMLPIAMSANMDLEISPECQSAILQFILDLKSQKMWTLQMLDAIGKPGSGILRGSTFFMGSYDQCLDISTDIRKDVTLNGQYCLVQIRAPIPPRQPSVKPFGQSKYMNFQNTSLEGTVFDNIPNSAIMLLSEMPVMFGLCVPSLCTPNDITSISNLIHQKTKFKPHVINCDTNKPKEWNIMQILFVVFLSLMVLLASIGTSVDYFVTKYSKDEKKVKSPSDVKVSSTLLETLMCFSLSKNLDKLTTSKTISRLPVLDGMKILSMMWIIYTNTYVMTFFAALDEKITLLQFKDQILFHGIMNGMYAADTLFVISGLLLCYISLKLFRCDAPGRFPFIYIIINRYLRLLPMVLAAIAISFFVPILTSGPIQKVAHEALERPCRQNWWATVLYMSNFLPTEEMCLGLTWHVSTDFQMYVVCLLPVYLFTRWPKKAIITLFLIAVSGLGISYYLFELYDLYSNFPPTDRKGGTTFFEVQTAMPFTHAPVFAIGVGLGYLLFYHEHMKINKIFEGILWIVSLGSCWTLMWGTYNWREELHPSKIDFYSLFLVGRTVWALCIAWILFACMSGRGGIINKILDSKILAPFGRITYSLFYTNMLVMQCRMESIRNNQIASHYMWMCEFIINTVMGLVLSFIFFLIIEAPLLSLKNYMLKQKLRRFMKC